MLIRIALIQSPAAGHFLHPFRKASLHTGLSRIAGLLSEAEVCLHGSIHASMVHLTGWQWSATPTDQISLRREMEEVAVWHDAMCSSPFVWVTRCPRFPHFGNSATCEMAVTFPSFVSSLFQF